MSKPRFTPKDLQNTINRYNEFLANIDHPWRFDNHAFSGMQSLVIVRYPSTSAQNVATGSSRECDSAISHAWNQLYVRACTGERVVKILKCESVTGNITHVPDPMPVFYNKERSSVHTFIKNIMESCGLWSIVYTVDDVQFTQTRKTLV